MPPASPDLSQQEAEAKYSKAANAELAKDFNKAFRLYLQAAEQYLRLSHQATDDRHRASFKTEATKALERAEKIKAVKQDVKPVAKDEFSAGEQLYVLRKSSLINEGFFPLWDSPHPPSPSSEQPPLSAEQIEHAASWRRPDSSRQQLGLDDSSGDLKPEDVVQHIVSDCSVCGAIVVAIDHDRRFGSKLVRSSLFSLERSGVPPAHPGQYQLQILYNGAYRRVNIDDQLPSYPDGTLMCVSTGEKRQLWPSLVEKAYMKLAGGYDFIGSDSSTDLRALAGWIPEIVDMKGPHFQREKTWERLINGYLAGTCVATLGTGERVPTTDLPMDLLPTHCYAIIGVHDTPNGDRTLTIFDPWVQMSKEEAPAEAESPDHKRKRAINIQIDSVPRFFDGIYFSWDPGLFKHELTFHGLWKREGLSGDTAAHFRTQLQLDLSDRVQDGEEVWILLTRHLRSHRGQKEYIALTVHNGSGASSSSANEALSTKGEYTNVPHVLIRTQILQTDDLITIVASYEGDREGVGFTLTIYSQRTASWAHVPHKFLYSKEIEGAFTQKTAGGNHTHPTYYLDPQYYLRVHSPPASDAGPSSRASRDTKADVSIAVSTDRHIPANIMLAWSQGERVTDLGHNDLALSSGPYSYGYAHAFGRIPPGDYTLIVSAFEPHHIGKFGLRVECSDRFDLTPILQEGAGMFNKIVRGEWTAETAGGAPSSKSYSSNPIYELQISSVSQLTFRLRLASPLPSTALNLTVFTTSASSSNATLGHHIATSGPYSDAVSGVTIEKVTLQPGRYLVVPSTYRAGVQAEFMLIVYSSASGVQIGPYRR